MLPHLKAKHPCYTFSHDVISGGTLSDIHNSLPKDPEFISTFDVTIVVCNVNTPGGKKGPCVFAPGSDQGIAMMRPCMELTSGAWRKRSAGMPWCPSLSPSPTPLASWPLAVKSITTA